MIQSSLRDKICSLHSKKIISFCINLNCNQNRFICFDCLTKDLHFGHHNCLKEFTTFEEILNQKRLECQDLISKLIQMMDQILFTFYRLKNGINNKYNISIERINIIPNDQINQYISTILQFDQQAEEITNKMENICSNFTNNLNSQLIELQLDQLNYIEISKDDQEKAEKFYQEGYTLYWDKDDFQGAIKLLDQSLIYNPNHKLSLWCKGQSLALMSQHKESIEWFDKALSIDSKDVDSLYGKGVALRMIDQYKESIEWYDKALSIDSKHVFSLIGKGVALRLMGQYKESIEWYDKALSIDSKNVFSLSGKGEALRMMDQYKESIEWYDKALSIDSKHVNSLIGKGEALRMLQDYKQSLEYLDKSLQVNPNYILSLGSKGACLNSLELYREAFKCFRKAIQLDPNNQFSINEMKICQDQL